MEKIKHFSRASKASILKFHILQDRDDIINGTKKVKKYTRVSSQPLINESEHKAVKELLVKINPLELKTDSKYTTPSAAFLSPGRKEPFPVNTDAPDPVYSINYKLVQKAPVFYSMSTVKPKPVVPRVPDTILSTNLHQFPQNDQKGLHFKNQTPRKDLLTGQPSPHEERFNTHNLIPKSCSKFNFVGSPRFDKYADRKEFYIKKEFSPDYRPNKEFILPRITKDIVFKGQTDRRNREIDWVCLGTDLESYDKKVFIDQMTSRNEKNKRSSLPRLPTEL